MSIISTTGTQVVPEGGSSSEAERICVQLVDVSSPIREEEPLPPPTSPRKRAAEDSLIGSKRPRLSEWGSREFSAMDRSFDASGFIGVSLLGPRVQEALQDYDPVQSVRWAEWAMLRSATILKSVEPRLTVANEVERRNNKLLGDLKALNLQKVALEGEKTEAVAAQLKSWFPRLRGLVVEEKVRADLVEVSASELHKQCEELAEEAKAAVSATESALKAQLTILVPDFDSSQIGFFKDIVDGKVLDPSG
ncbi:hypothetical protein PIB30_039175 [Stylosanthes scabra]|uniref:Uncharacterized protein n=1 Tax=Stylosanthes scabra TaxID=79078 RepID=A0ABU6WEL4_9FABA|nr:hypothetical protein [Stylosanthes scabra]